MEEVQVTKAKAVELDSEAYVMAFNGSHWFRLTAASSLDYAEQIAQGAPGTTAEGVDRFDYLTEEQVRELGLS